MKICIDPGHGMGNHQRGIFDPGAVYFENGHEFKEAEIVLRYALALKERLRGGGAEVFMTRDDATDHAPLEARAAMARDAGCKAFISLHVNSVEDDRANGLEVLYRDADDLPLAQALQDALVKVTKMRDRKVKQRPELAVLKFKGIAVLIELGFLRNDADRAKLLSAQIRQAVAQTIAATTLATLAQA